MILDRIHFNYCLTTINSTEMYTATQQTLKRLIQH